MNVPAYSKGLRDSCYFPHVSDTLFVSNLQPFVLALSAMNTRLIKNTNRTDNLYSPKARGVFENEVIPQAERLPLLSHPRLIDLFPRNAAQSYNSYNQLILH